MARSQSPTQDTTRAKQFTTPEGQENYCVSLAYNLVERRLREGTASSQETTHFLNRGSEKSRLEIQRLEEENKLLRAKTEALQSAKQIEELYSNAISAMRRYSGQDDQHDDDY